jgi:hypothetical protein
MIAKSISYQHLFRGITTISSADRKALFAGWAVAKYVLGLELDADETALIREASNISVYGPDGRGDDARVLDAKVFNLDGNTQHDQALEFAYRIAASGKNSLRQIVVAYGDEPVTDEMAARHRDIFRRVLRAEDKPMIYSKHGDTRYDHWHLAVCTADCKSGKVGKWGQEMEIEALHIAMAICEAQDNLEPEPNRRYAADETGIYHTWSGIKVAEANGDIINRGAFKAVEAEQVKFDTEALAPSDSYVGQALPTTKAIKLLARGVSRNAETWDDLHRGLARIGIRYEPYRAEGEIAGGHLVANGVRDKEDDRIPASAVNAGYKRLCNKLGGRPYEPPSKDIRVRPFVAPAFRKMAEEPSQDRPHELNLQEHLDEQARIGLEFQEFKHALKNRVDAIKAERADGAEAREKMASIEEKRRHHNHQQKREKASREEADRILRELQLAFERETGRKRKGPRPKAVPASSVLWGEPDKLDPAPQKGPGQWAKRYAIETLDQSRVYRLNGKIAFVETASFIAVHTQDRQAKIDALRRAQEKFGRVKVVGPASYRREMLLLAAQEQIPLDARQAKEAEKLLEKAKSKLKSEDEGIVYRAAPQRQEPKKPKVCSLDEKADEGQRAQRSDRFTVELLQEFHRRNAREDEDRKKGKPNATRAPVAHRFLTEMNCDTLLMCSSRFSVSCIRFLDDEELLKKFEKLPNALVRPEIQQRLEAIRRVQQAKRNWIFKGLADGKFNLSGTTLKIPDSYGDWAAAFVKRQKSDPTFIRQLGEAANGEYSDKNVDLAVRPEVAVWRKSLSGSGEDQALACYIVDELIRTTNDADRKSIFRMMRYDEAEKLRRTEGLAAKTYAGFFYQQDGESDRAFARRRSNAQRNGRNQGW